jgi:hypothetical protein
MKTVEAESHLGKGSTFRVTLSMLVTVSETGK